MKSYSHKLVTGFGVLAITGDPLISLITAGFSTFPDRIEYLSYWTEEEWEKNHRTWFHWFIPYLLLASVLYFFLSEKGILLNSGSPNSGYLSNAVAFMENIVTGRSFDSPLAIILGMNLMLLLCIASLFHILEDAVCGRIPFLSPKKYIRLPRLFYVGSFEEIFFVVSFSIMVIAYKFPNLLSDAQFLFQLGSSIFHAVLS